MIACPVLHMSREHMSVKQNRSDSMNIDLHELIIQSIVHFIYVSRVYSTSQELLDLYFYVFIDRMTCAICICVSCQGMAD